ncbi:HlyD family type I secretion periplasmic adaptor subunit [Telmatospirillum sp.]|uniref:HlyD family type I secretion periplasmic adaptor subunit n=1 Tax=Telmatospirillum sp. TaxID=2079197 RepID=UPI00283FA93C|nr:HlyD family type I secretion periplasmic adaptor subunit [Telmatospirillum sp.]MDR3440801.1 HlyD family type I secretion periplasmic adaptor subunit [Telmatospirillum sp.]
MRSVLYVIAVSFISSVILSAIVKVDTVIVGTGVLTTEVPPIMLQPMDRGIIRELKVKAGDVVTKGQVLATLDPTFAKADLATLTLQQRSLSAEINRLEAEINDRPLPIGNIASSEELLQATLYAQRREQYKSRLRVFDEDIQNLTASLRTTEDARQSLGHQLGVSKDVEGMRSALMQMQTGSRLNYLEAEAARMRIERDHQDAVNRLIELQHSIQSKQAERQAFIDDWRRQLLENLVSARTEVAKLSEGVSKASLTNDLVVVTAPEDGVVLDVAKRSVGSILNAAEPLVTIIPANAPLVADIEINSADVGFTNPGEEVVLKIDAFPYQQHGFLHGRLLFVSEESFTIKNATQDNSSFGGRSSSNAAHHGRIELLGTDLEHMPKGARLIPGMTLAAEVKVGARSVMSFFLYPVLRGFSESLREP